MKSVRPPPVNEMISQKIFFFTFDGFPKYYQLVKPMNLAVETAANKSELCASPH